MLDIPAGFQETFDALYTAIADGQLSLDYAVELTRAIVDGTWGHLNKLFQIAGL